MIGDAVAERMGIKFLREEKCFKLAGGLEQGACLNGTFRNAIKTLGKKKVAQLYKRLPKQLKTYMLWTLDPDNDKRFGKKCMQIWDGYYYLHYVDHPDRCKGFADYYREAEEALLKYFRTRK